MDLKLGCGRGIEGREAILQAQRLKQECGVGQLLILLVFIFIFLCLRDLFSHTHVYSIPSNCNYFP